MSYDGRSPDKLPRLDWYPQDYLADPKVRAFTWEEHGVYLLLLWAEWIDGPLPADPKRLARIVGGSPDDFARVWETVRECFDEQDDLVVNLRLERERALALKTREDKAKGGKKRWKGVSKGARAGHAKRAAAARWGSKQDASTDASRMQAGMQADASPSPQGVLRTPKGGAARAGARPPSRKAIEDAEREVERLFERRADEIAEKYGVGTHDAIHAHLIQTDPDYEHASRHLDNLRARA